MKEKFRRYKIFIYMIGVVISVFFAVHLYFSFDFNLNEIIGETLKRYAGLNVKFEKVVFTRIGVIELKNVTLKDKKGDTLVIAPTLIITYDKKSFSKITEIRVKGAKINFEMSGDYKINFVEAFKSKDTDKKSQSILKKIVVEESSFYYADIMKSKKISRKLDNLNGVIEFKDNSEVVIRAKGNRDKESYEFNMDYINSDKYEIGLKLQNILVDNSVMQYGYSSKDIDYKSGKANLDLKIKPHGILYGSAKLIDGTVSYIDVSKDIKDGGADVVFKGKGIEVNAFGYIEKRKYEIAIKHNLENSNTEIGIELKNINIEKEKDLYRPLKEYKIPLKGEVENLKIVVLIDSLKNSKLKLNYTGKDIFYNDTKIETLNGEAEYYSNNIILKENIIKIKDYISTKLNLKGIIKDGNFSGDYTLEDIKSLVEIEKIDGKINYYSKKNSLIIIAKNGNKLDLKLEAEMKSGIIKTELNSMEGIGLEYKDTKINFIGKINGEYNTGNDYLTVDINSTDGTFIKNGNEKINIKLESVILLKPMRKEIINGEGKLTITDLYGVDTISTDFTMENNYFNFENSVIKKGDSFIYLKGYYSLNGGKYAFNILDSELNLKDIDKNKEAEGIIQAEGIISGNNLSEAEGMIELKSSDGKYKEIKYKNIYTTLNIIYKDGKLRVNGIGEAKESSYQNEKLEELNFNFRYRDNTVYIDNLYNNSLTLKGYYNIISGNMNFDFGVRKYKIENIELIKEKKIQGYVENITGKAEGNIKDPLVQIEVKNLMLSYDIYKNILFNGNVFYKNGEIKTDSFKINQNSVSAKYNLEKGDIEAKINLFENNLGRYLGITEIKGRTIGEIIVWGNIRDLKAAGNISSDNFYYKDKKIPEMTLKFTYNKGSIENIRKTGKISISSLDIITQKKEKVVSGTGFVNFENDTLEFDVKDYNIDISKIDYLNLQTNNSIRGNLNLNLNLKGTFNDFKYSAEVKSKELKIYDTYIESVEIAILGNKEGVELKEANINYSGNNFYANGSLKYNPFSYGMNLSGKKINLKILNLFTKGKLKNIRGEADADLKIGSIESSGNIVLRNIGFDTESSDIRVNNFNVTASLEKNKLKIFEATANINEGKIMGFGEVELSNIQPEEFKFKEFKAESWNLAVTFNNIKYNSGNYLSLYLGGKLKIKNKSITGDLEIQKGELRGVPESKNNDEGNKIIIPEEWSALVDFKLNKLFKLNINKYSIIEGLEANLEGNGRILLQKGNINFLGTISTEKGVIEVNKNFFEIESGVIVFDDPLQYYPELNPSLAIKATTDVANEEITVGVTGYLKSPNVVLTSENNLANDDIISLLAFHKTLVDTTPKGVIKDVLERQLNEEIFNPISKKLSKTLGIEKVKISSNILEDSDEELKFTKDIRLGANLEVGDSIYKDKVYWNIKTKLSESTAGKWDSYNIWLDYKVLDWISISTGVEQKADVIENDKLNLHIGLEINKKVDFNF